MARPRNPVPSFRRHRPSGRAYSDFTDPLTGGRRTVCLGPWGSAEAKEAHARLCAELAAGRPPRLDGLSLNELFLAFLRHADRHYRRPDGSPTSEVKNYKLMIRLVRETHGDTPAVGFGPLALNAVRERMVAAGWCRQRVNKEVIRLRHVFKWAVGEELVPASVHEGLRAVGGLQAGRTDAREAGPVRPVPEADYLATLPHLPRVARAVMEFLRLTGCRPGEACRLRWNELDRTSAVWVYRPVAHKNAHRGNGRAIPVGPQAQAALLRFLAGRVPPPAVAFDPADPGQRAAAAAEYDRAFRPADTALLRELVRAVEVVSGCVIDPSAPLFDPARDPRSGSPRCG